MLTVQSTVAVITTANGCDRTSIAKDDAKLPRPYELSDNTGNIRSNDERNDRHQLYQNVH